MKRLILCILTLLYSTQLTVPAFSQGPPTGSSSHPVKTAVNPTPPAPSSIKFLDAVPQNNPALTYPAGASYAQLQLWQKNSIASVNILWDKSQAQAEEQRRNTRDPQTLKKINKWIQALRIATLRWVQDISNIFAALVKIIGTTGNRKVPPFNESPYRPNGGTTWPGPLPTTVPGPGPIPGPGPGPIPGPVPAPIPFPIKVKVPIETESGEIKTLEVQVNSRMIDRNPDPRIILLLFGKMKKYKCPAPHNMAITSWTFAQRKPGSFVPTYRDYRTVFFKFYPFLAQWSPMIEVHHAIEQNVLKRHPGLFLDDEIVLAIENLRGICGDAARHQLHRQIIRFMWDAFSSYHKFFNIPTTREDCIWYCRAIDDCIGDEFYPYYNPSLNRPLLLPLPWEIQTIPR